MKASDMLEWMTELDPRFLEESEQPLIMRKKRRRKYAPAFIASAAAVLCMAAGAAAYAARNTDMLNIFFGKEGTESIISGELPEPVTFSNGRICVTLETTLNDGINQMLLLSFADMNGDPIGKPHGCRAVARKDGLLLPGASFGYGITANGIKECYLAMYISCDGISEGENIVLTFPEWSYAEGENPLDGIEIPFTMHKNTDSAQFVSEDGDMLTLSDFELIYEFEVPAVISDDEWSLIENKQMNNREKYLLMKDGTKHRMFSGSSGGTRKSDNASVWREHDDIYIEKIPGEWDDIDFTGSDGHRNPLEDPTEYLGYLNINDAEAVEVNGIIYTKQ